MLDNIQLGTGSIEGHNQAAVLDHVEDHIAKIVVIARLKFVQGRSRDQIGEAVLSDGDQVNVVEVRAIAASVNRTLSSDCSRPG